MTDEEVRVEVNALRESADTWFPVMVEATNQANLRMRGGTGQVGGAFAHPLDLVNGAVWFVLMVQFTDMLGESAVRLVDAQLALRQTADSYEDADEDSAMRIEVTG